MMTLLPQIFSFQVVCICTYMKDLHSQSHGTTWVFQLLHYKSSLATISRKMQDVENGKKQTALWRMAPWNFHSIPYWSDFNHIVIHSCKKDLLKNYSVYMKAWIKKCNNSVMRQKKKKNTTSIWRQQQFLPHTGHMISIKCKMITRK